LPWFSGIWTSTTGYYLIGLRVKSGDSVVQHSFWANDAAEEKEIWTSLLRTLSEVENPQIVHDGGYEKEFLKRMKDRYPEAAENPDFLARLIARLIAESVNLLSVLYAQIYFPTCSNGLKERERYLGFQWSNSTPSGLTVLMWRDEWERSQNPALKQKLVTYNAEDYEPMVLVQMAQNHGKIGSLAPCGRRRMGWTAVRRRVLPLDDAHKGLDYPFRAGFVR
jgi:predicted RecB family nuclease